MIYHCLLLNLKLSNVDVGEVRCVPCLYTYLDQVTAYHFLISILNIVLDSEWSDAFVIQLV